MYYKNHSCDPEPNHQPTSATAEATAVEDAVALPQPLAAPVVITVTDALAMAVAAAIGEGAGGQGGSTPDCLQFSAPVLCIAQLLSPAVHVRPASPASQAKTCLLQTPWPGQQSWLRPASQNECICN